MNRRAFLSGSLGVAGVALVAAAKIATEPAVASVNHARHVHETFDVDYATGKRRRRRVMLGDHDTGRMPANGAIHAYSVTWKCNHSH